GAPPARPPAAQEILSRFDTPLAQEAGQGLDWVAQARRQRRTDAAGGRARHSTKKSKGKRGKRKR
ncbi:hypothetical protein AB0C69_39455, partial [Actinomadura sp. NPDC048032]|uniref:hypothetical protein n=1 Tax=Actinomadura sp. NPDC048032 TaxID=3155747 RepID=UPI00340A5B58